MLHRRRLPFARISSILLPLALAGACSSSSNPETTPDVSPGDAQPEGDAEPQADAQPTGDADTGAPHDGGPDGALPDAGAPVWLADSIGFELTSSGGLLPAPVDAAACNGNSVLWHYDAASRTLARTGCTVGQTLAATVTLTPAAAGDVVARLSALTAHGATPGACGADAPDVVLTVLGPGGSPTSYDGDFYSGCAGFDAGGRLFVSFANLEDLQSHLNDYAAACTVDAGSPTDAGATCVARPADGGPVDASAGG